MQTENRIVFLYNLKYKNATKTSHFSYVKNTRIGSLLTFINKQKEFWDNVRSIWKGPF